MLVNGEPYVIEYNVRMGDPETQVVMPMMEVSLLDLIESTLDKTLDTFLYKNKDGYCVTVVLASQGYPGSYKVEKIIHGFSDLGSDLVFHAGTKLDNQNNLVSSGGRVLNVTCSAKSLNEARDQSLINLKKINWIEGFFRKDIDWRAIKK